MNKKNIALIGSGRWGKNLARNFYELEALHTLCDLNEDVLKNYKQSFPGIATSTSFKSVLSNPEIKRVVIATPAQFHYEHGKQALLAGKDLYVEKPLCLNFTEAQELIRLAKEKERILMVGHLLQYHPCITKLQELLKTGELGKLQYVSSNRLNLGTIRTEENSLWSFAPHDISVILSLCGNKFPEQVRCMGAAYLSKNIADVSMTTLSFANNVAAHIYVSWLNPFKEQKLTVVGSKGMVVFDDMQAWDKKLMIYRDHLTWSEGHIPLPNKKKGEPVALEHKEPLREECLHFIECCNNRMTPRTHGEEGLRVLKVLQSAQASLNSGGEAINPKEFQGVSLDYTNYFSHATAVIDEGAVIGNDSKIWHNSHVMSQAKIGEKCNIGQNVFVASGAQLGNNVKVQNNVSLYEGVVCENDVFLGPSMVFTNIKNPRSHVVRKGQYTKTLLRQGSTVGANATIVCGVELGEYCFIGAGTVVTQNIKPFALVVGNPGKQIGWMSAHGERLDLPVAIAEDEEQSAFCPATKERYVLRGENLFAIEECSKPVIMQEVNSENPAAV